MFFHCRSIKSWKNPSQSQSDSTNKQISCAISCQFYIFSATIEESKLAQQQRFQFENFYYFFLFTHILMAYKTMLNSIAFCCYTCSFVQYIYIYRKSCECDSQNMVNTAEERKHDQQNKNHFKQHHQVIYIYLCYFDSFEFSPSDTRSISLRSRARAISVCFTHTKSTGRHKNNKKNKMKHMTCVSVVGESE